MSVQNSLLLTAILALTNGCWHQETRDFGVGRCVDTAVTYCPNFNSPRCYYQVTGCRVCTCDDEDPRR